MWRIHLVNGAPFISTGVPILPHPLAKILVPCFPGSAGPLAGIASAGLGSPALMPRGVSHEGHFFSSRAHASPS